MSNLTIDDLAQLINQAPKAKKPRKKAEQTPEQRELMLEKLALMRAKSIEKRNAKKAQAQAEPVEPPKPQPKAQPQVQAPPPQPAPVQPNNDLFEKHYNSKFDELKDSINGINNSINQMKQLKLEKAELKRKKAEEKIQLEAKKTEEVKEPELSQVKTQSQGDVVQPTPPQVNLNVNRVMKPNVNYKSFFKR